MARILIVDDHTLFREGMRLLLGTLGPEHEILQAGSLAEAVTRLEQDPNFSLILLDLAMSDGSGLQSLDKINAHADHVPVVILSGTEDPDIIRAAIDCGAMGYILKSAPPSQMIQALNLVLSGGVYLPAVALSASSERSISFNPIAMSPRQRDVLSLVVKGMSNKRIARELGVEESTIKTHMSGLFDILGVHNRTEIVYVAAKLRLVSIPLE
jgi:DNA-binding NarL/FixJ family response regulator